MESLRMAITSLRINQTRALLTALGIIIGVASVVTMVSLSEGFEAFIDDQFDDLGADVLTITSQDPDSDTRDEIAPLTNAEAEALSNPRIAPHIRDVVMQYDVSGIAVANGETVRVAAQGVTPNYDDINGWGVTNGVFITTTHNNTRERVVVVGTTVAETLFGEDVSIIGEIIEFNDVPFEVIGVMEEASSQDFFDPNKVIFVPLSVAQTNLDNARVRGGTYELLRIQVAAITPEDTSTAQQEIYDYLFAAHDIGFVGDEDFAIADAGDVADSLDTITSMLTIFLGMIAGISLLVGGIGIMNIMLVSVTERTKEVGLRKAVGASYGDILTQFLAESVLLSVLGGIVGVIIAWVLVAVTSALVDGLTAGMSASAVGLAVGVSTFIGVFFGAYPASRAARMRPIDALRAS